MILSVVPPDALPCASVFSPEPSLAGQFHRPPLMTRSFPAGFFRGEAVAVPHLVGWGLHPPPNGRSFALGAASHAADELVSGDAVAHPEIRGALKVNLVWQRPIGLVGRMVQSRPTKHGNELLLRELHGIGHRPGEA